MSMTRVPDGGEQYIEVGNLTWDGYEAILGALSERSHVRLVYLDGGLTLLSPSRQHDWYAKILGHLVAAIAQGLGIECEVAGHATYRLEGEDAGVEGDDAFYLGENAVRMRGPQKVDLATQPPPDLVIEVELTHPADKALAAWGRLGVPEVWRFDAEKVAITFGRRRDDGSYEFSGESRAFAGLDAAKVVDQLRRAERVGFSSWLAGLGDWVRGELRPGAGR